MRKSLTILGWTLLAIAMLLALFAAFNFTYLERTFTSSSVERVRDISWFEPKVKLEPASNHAVLKSSQAEENSERFKVAIDYAEQVNSSAFLVWQKDRLLVEKYWPPYDASSYTQTNSIHKSLLGMAVGIAIEEGDILSLDDPVSDYLGDWINLDLGEIRVEHLLNMSSGLGKPPARIPLFDHFVRLLNSTDISKVAQSLPQRSSPGTEFEYINNNPQLLVDLLEVATGMPYEEYLEQKIWAKVAGNSGYLWMDRDGGVPHGYCCLMALPEDLLRVGLLILNQGRSNGLQVVPEDWIAKMITPSELNPNYGYLVWLGTEYVSLRKPSKTSEFGSLHSEPFVADDLVYFDGFGGQRVYIVPSRELVIVRVGENRFDFDDSVLPNAVLGAIPASAELADPPQVFTSSYLNKADNTNTQEEPNNFSEISDRSSVNS